MRFNVKGNNLGYKAETMALYDKSYELYEEQELIVFE